MEIVKFSEKNLMLLVDIEKRGKITSATQSLYGGWSFYGAIKFLEKNGLVKNSGVNKENMIEWTLTEKGKKFVNLIKQVEDLLGG